MAINSEGTLQAGEGEGARGGGGREEGREGGRERERGLEGERK